MPLMTKQKARQLNGLQLAYMGDTVCDLIARTQTMFSGKPVKEMHADATARVNARAQAEQLRRIQHLLEEDERTLMIWRIMLPEEHTGHGYGRAAVEEVIRRAKAVLAEIEIRQPGVLPSLAPQPEPEEDDGQITLGAFAEKAVMDQLRQLEPDTLSPIEALGLLYQLTKQAKEC